MSGYLERLTRDVKNPGGSLRPVVGSIFSPTVEGRSEFGAVGEDVASAATSPTSVTGLMESKREVSSESLAGVRPLPFEPISIVSREDEHGQGSIERRFEERDLATPRTARDQEGSYQAQRGERSVRATPSLQMFVSVPHRSPLERAHLQSDEGPQTRQSPSAVDAASPVPLMRVREENAKPEQLLRRVVRRTEADPGAGPDDGLKALRDDVLNRRGESAKAASRLSLPPKSASSAGAARQGVGAVNALQPATAMPDEIHIHIGRIEVTAAAPQAAPRPRPMPLRKGPELGEYLKKGGRG